MRILSTVFFSKFFGGKICHIWTDVTYKANKFFQKNWAHAYFERPYKTLAGKLQILN